MLSREAWAAGVRPTLVRELASALSAAAAVGLTTGLAATALAARANPSLRDARDAAHFLLLGGLTYAVVLVPLGLVGLVLVRWVGLRPRGRAAAQSAGDEPGATSGVAADPRIDPRAADARSRFPFSTHAAVLLAGVGAYALTHALGGRRAGWSEAATLPLALALTATGIAVALAALVATRRVFQGFIGPRRWLIPIVLLFLCGLFLLVGVGGGVAEAHTRATDVEVLGGSATAPPRVEAALAGLPAPHQRRVVLLALDGADSERIDALLAAGELPGFRRLLEHGVRAPLRVERPAWPTVAWTSVATGVPPYVHGVCDLVEVRVPGLSRPLQRVREHHGEPPLLPAGLGLRPIVAGALGHLLDARHLEERAVSSHQRRAKAVWNLLAERGLPVAVVHWPASRPAESLHGWIVADDAGEPAGTDRLATAGGDDELFTPPELRAELADLLELRAAGEGLEPIGPAAGPRAPRMIDTATASPSAPTPLPILARLSAPELAALAPARLDEARAILADDAFAARAALRLWRERRPLFLAVCLRGLDRLEERLADVPGAIEGTYRWIDQALSTWLDAAGDEGTLVVVSAYGRPRAGERGTGVLVLGGAHVRAGVEFGEPPSILDVAPTLLALYGLPSSREMPGRALLEALEVAARPGALQHPASYGAYSVHAAPPRGGDAASGPAKGD